MLERRPVELEKVRLRYWLAITASPASADSPLNGEKEVIFGIERRRCARSSARAATLTKKVENPSAGSWLALKNNSYEEFKLEFEPNFSLKFGVVENFVDDEGKEEA